MSPRIHGVVEHRFIDPATVIDGKDPRGWDVEGVWSRESEGPTRLVGRGKTEPWSAQFDAAAIRFYLCAEGYAKEMMILGHLSQRHDPPRFGHEAHDGPNRPCARCQEITHSAASATYTDQRTHFAKINVPPPTETT